MKTRDRLTRVGRVGLTAVCLLTLTVVVGCNAPQRSVIGTSVLGDKIECVSYGGGERVVLIMATIHGNEPAGTPLVNRLMEELEAEPQWLKGRRVLIIPVANPDGYLAGTRYNANQVDLNRNFPATNFEASELHGDAPLQEPESGAILRLIEEEKPWQIVSIHQPLACIDYDGPGEAMAEAMGAHTDLPVRKLGGRAGSLGSYAGVNHGIPIITLELPEEATGMSEAELWQRYGRSLLAAIRYPELIDAS